MVIGALRVVLSIPGSMSLKDKRHVVKSVLETARNRFNASAAEIDYLDSHRRAEIAFACVSNDRTVANTLLNKILDRIKSNPLCEVEDSSLELI